MILPDFLKPENCPQEIDPESKRMLEAMKRYVEEMGDDLITEPSSYTDGEGGMLTDIMISVLKMSIDEKSIKAVFVSISVKNRKKFMHFSVNFHEFYVDFYTN